MKRSAAIFDMDGVLVDSEPLWQEAEILCFSRGGISLTRDMCRETMGLRVDEAVAYWFERYPCAGYSPDTMCEAVLDEVERLIRERAKPLPGVIQLLTWLKQQNIPVALASSSLYRTIEAVLSATGLEKFFPVIHSAEEELLGKPDPAVYLSAARKLNVSPEACIAFEDSVNGMRAAKAAGMFTVVIPEHSAYGDSRFAPADLRLTTLEAFTPEKFIQATPG